MEKAKRSRLQRVVTTALALVMVCIMALPAEAATNKALCIKGNFNGMSWAKNGDKFGYYDCYTAIFDDTQKAAAISKLKLGCVTYIPKKIFDKKEASVSIHMYLDLDKKNSYYGSASGRYNITAVKEGKKVVVHAWDEQAEKVVLKPKTATIKSGKGAYKNYYIVTLKNIPICNRISLENGKSVKLKAKDSFKYRVAATISAENYKGRTDVYLDDVVAVSGSKKLVNINFNKKTGLNIINRGKLTSKKNFTIKKF